MSRTARIAAVCCCRCALRGRRLVVDRHRRAPRHPNLLLITIDTLRADHVGAYGATSGATPALDALAAARRPVRSGPDRRSAHRSLARDDPHRPVPARARRPRQRRLHARLEISDARNAAEARRAIRPRRSSAPTRWPRRSASTRDSTPSTRTSTRRSPGEPGGGAPRERSGRCGAPLA